MLASWRLGAEAAVTSQRGGLALFGSEVASSRPSAAARARPSARVAANARDPTASRCR